MNSRIRALADQCYYDDNVRPDGSRISEQEFMIFDKQKFAELIVQECFTVIKDSDEFAKFEIDFIDREFKKHFGVEQ